MFSIAVYFGTQLLFTYLPEVTSGEKCIVLPTTMTGWKKDCSVYFYAVDGLWRVTCPEGMFWKTANQKPLDRAISDGFNMSAGGPVGALGIYCRLMSRSNTVMSKYKTRSFISIGREDSDIIIDDKYISDRHGEIIYNNGKWIYKDISKNGSYVNSKRLLQQQVQLQIGDIISYACGVRVAFYGGVIAIGGGNCVGSIALENMELADLSRTENLSRDAFTIITRSPHFYHAIENTSYQMEPAPVFDSKLSQPLLLTIGPSLTMSIPMLMGSFLAGTSGYAKSGVIMMVTSSVLAVAWALANHYYNKNAAQKEYKAQIDDYLERLGNFEQDVEIKMKNAADELLTIYPSAKECLDYLTRNKIHIWKNDVESVGFLTARIGTGMAKLPCEIVLPKLKMGEHPTDIEDAPFKAAERLNKLYPVPICVSFSTGAPIGIICAQDQYDLIQSIILQLVSLNSYLDCRIAVVGSEVSEYRWKSMALLPF